MMWAAWLHGSGQSLSSELIVVRITTVPWFGGLTLTHSWSIPVIGTSIWRLYYILLHLRHTPVLKPEIPQHNLDKLLTPLMNEAIEGAHKKAWCLGSEIFWEECRFYHDTKWNVPGKRVERPQSLGWVFGERREIASLVIGTKVQHR